MIRLNFVDVHGAEDGCDQDCDQEPWGDPFDHDNKYLLTFEFSVSLSYFIRDSIRFDDKANEQTGEKGNDWHQDTVTEEIHDIENRHSSQSDVA